MSSISLQTEVGLFLKLIHFRTLIGFFMKLN